MRDFFFCSISTTQMNSYSSSFLDCNEPSAEISQHSVSINFLSTSFVPSSLGYANSYLHIALAICCLLLQVFFRLSRYNSWLVKLRFLTCSAWCSNRILSSGEEELDTISLIWSLSCFVPTVLFSKSDQRVKISLFRFVLVKFKHFFTFKFTVNFARLFRWKLYL